MAWGCSRGPSGFLHLVNRTAQRFPDRPRPPFCLCTPGGLLDAFTPGTDVERKETGMWSEKEKGPLFRFPGVLTQARVSFHSAPVLDLVTLQYLSPGKNLGAHWSSHAVLLMAQKRQVTGPAFHSQLVTKSRMKPWCLGSQCRVISVSSYGSKLLTFQTLPVRLCSGPRAAGPLDSSQHFGAGEGAPGSWGMGPSARALHPRQ